MRTLILLGLVALAVAYAIGLVEVATYHPEGKYVASLTVNTAMLLPYERRRSKCCARQG